MRIKTAFVAAFVAFTPPSASVAQCLMAVTGANCVSAPKSSTPAPSPVEIGSYLTRGEHSVMMNAGYYGLPPVSDGWVYMRIDDDVYRVDFGTFQVLERVTDQTNYYFH